MAKNGNLKEFVGYLWEDPNLQKGLTKVLRSPAETAFGLDVAFTRVPCAPGTLLGV